MSSPATRTVLALTAIAAVLAVAGCGGSDKTGGGDNGSGATGGSASQADLAAVCAAREKLAASVDDLKGMNVESVSDINDVTAQLNTVRENFERVNAEYKKLPAGAQAQWQSAESDFRLGFADAGLDLADAVRASDPGAASDKAIAKLAKSYETDYAGIDCP